MRRIFLVLTLCLAGVPHSLQADDRAAEAAARAQREEAEERYKLLNGKLENVTETQELLLKNEEKMRQRIEVLASEIEDIKRAQIRGAANTVTPEQLNALVEKLKEIDQKRIADNEHVLKVLGDLQKMPVGPIPPVAEKSSSAKAPEATANSGTTW
jgi:hypothetical protein